MTGARTSGDRLLNCDGCAQPFVAAARNTRFCSRLCSSRHHEAHRPKRDPDALKQYRRAYYIANKTRIQEQQRAYNEVHCDRIAERKRAHRAEHREGDLARQRSYYLRTRQLVAPKGRVCEECGTTFLSKAHNAKYCSSSCATGAANEARRRQTQRVVACGWCRNDFVPNGTAKYCSESCRSAYRKSHRDREKEADSARRYRASNRDEMLARRRGAYARNPEYYRTVAREWHWANREKSLAGHRRWNEKAACAAFDALNQFKEDAQ